MNKADLIEHVANETGTTKADAQKAVEAVFGGITQTLKKFISVRPVG